MQNICFSASLVSDAMAFMLAIVFDKEIAKTVTSFLPVWDKSLRNSFLYYSYNT